MVVLVSTLIVRLAERFLKELKTRVQPQWGDATLNQVLVRVWSTGYMATHRGPPGQFN